MHRCNAVLHSIAQHGACKKQKHTFIILNSSETIYGPAVDRFARSTLITDITFVGFHSIHHPHGHSKRQEGSDSEPPTFCSCSSEATVHLHAGSTVCNAGVDTLLVEDTCEGFSPTASTLIDVPVLLDSLACNRVAWFAAPVAC
jgi:hypothetical protein